MPVLQLTSKQAESIAEIHAEALSGDFLPSLGTRFLKSFYEGVIKQESTFGFVYSQEEQPIGFIIGCLDSSRMFKRLAISSGFLLGWKALPAIIRRPHLIGNIIETIYYPNRQGQVSDKAELLVIAVKEGQRGRGIGHDLVKAFNTMVKEKGSLSYKVSVTETRPGAIKFYENEGFQQAAEFQLYNKSWLVFTRQV